MMRANSVKRKLAAGEPVFGAMLKMTAPAVVELVAHGGFDFVLFDAEHGALDFHLAEDMFRAAEATGIVPLVRVPNLDPATLVRYLDLGAMGLQIPNISTAEQAREAVQTCRYYPTGRRTLAKTRAFDYGSRAALSDYMERANQEILLSVMVEDATGVANVDQILAVDGLDVLCLGPYDLAHAMGLSEQTDPQVQAAMQRIAGKASAAGRALGLPGDVPSLVHRYLGWGARYIVASVEGVFIKGVRDYLAGLRERKSDESA